MSQRPPHVCIISCAHPIDDVRVMHKECAELRAAGFRVSWIGPDRGRRGETYGVEFHLYPAARSRSRRFLHHRQAIRLGRRLEGVDVFFAVEPDSGVAAVVLARAHKARAVFDVHEAYDRETLTRWVPRQGLALAGWAVRKAMEAIAARSDLVIGVNKAVLSPYKISTDTMIVRSCAPRSFADGAPAEAFLPERPRVTIMHGKSTLHHGTATVIKAIGIARKREPRLAVLLFDHFDRNPDKFTRADFDMLVKECEAADAVDLRPLIPMTEMPAVLRTCDIGVIAYNRTWGVSSLPNKLFEFMAAGLPIVAPEYSPEIRPIIEHERCGLVVDTERPEAIAEAFVHLCQRPDEARAMGERGRVAFLTRHNWSAEFRPAIERFHSWAERR